MKNRSLTRWWAGVLVVALLPGIAVAGAAHGQAQQEAASAFDNAQVTVTYNHPHQFTESKLAGFGHRYDHGDYLKKLKAYLVRKATPMLKPGQRLVVTITDIRLAGGYEPWRGPDWSDVRIMSDAYPPRIALRFKLTNAQGKVVRKGERKLNGLGYLHDQPASPGNTDPLRYDKGLLDRWLRGGPSHW
jgi:hypothetical protein